MTAVAQKPVFWLGKAKLNDFFTLKNVITERDAALRCLLQGKNEDLILGENNLREFEFMKSKLIFPNSDDASQHTEQEEVIDVTGEGIVDTIFPDWSLREINLGIPSTFCTDVY